MERQYRTPEELLAMAPSQLPEPVEPKVFEVELPDAPSMAPRDLAGLFSSLGNTARLDIVELLMMMEASGTDVAAALDLSLSAVSYHMGILEQGGAVTSRREGQLRCYKLTDPVRALLEQAMSLSAQALRR